MKIMAIYSTLTGNTKRVITKIQEVLPPDTPVYDIYQAPEPAEADLIILGFWINQGQPDYAANAYLDKMRQQKVAVIMTMGGPPDSELALGIVSDVGNRLKEQGCEVLGVFPCQGRMSPALLDLSKTLPPGHPRAGMSPERMARIQEAAKHPDESDLNRAADFVRGILTKLRAGQAWQQRRQL